MLEEHRPITDSAVLKYFCRHLVALCVVYRAKSADSVQQFTGYAGTIIHIADACYFLTAGHSLRKIKEALGNQEVIVERAILADAFGNPKFGEHPIPFDLENAPMFFIDDDEEGLDFGVVHVDDHLVRLLALNDVVVIDEPNWIHQHRVSFDGYSMLGLPEEWTSAFVSSTGYAVVSPTMLAVTRDVEAEAEQPTRHDRFIGQVVLPAGLQSLNGMSGGPIFGFNFEGGRARYWVVAIQSSWIPSTRQIYACRLPLLAALMTRWAQEANASRDSR